MARNETAEQAIARLTADLRRVQFERDALLRAQDERAEVERRNESFALSGPERDYLFGAIQFTPMLDCCDGRLSITHERACPYRRLLLLFGGQGVAEDEIEDARFEARLENARRDGQLHCWATVGDLENSRQEIAVVSLCGAHTFPIRMADNLIGLPIQFRSTPGQDGIPCNECLLASRGVAADLVRDRLLGWKQA